MTSVEELQRELELVKVNLDAMLTNAALANAPVEEEAEEEEEQSWHAC